MLPPMRAALGDSRSRDLPPGTGSAVAARSIVIRSYSRQKKELSRALHQVVTFV